MKSTLVLQMVLVGLPPFPPMSMFMDMCKWSATACNGTHCCKALWRIFESTLKYGERGQDAMKPRAINTSVYQKCISTKTIVRQLSSRLFETSHCLLTDHKQLFELIPASGTLSRSLYGTSLLSHVPALIRLWQVTYARQESLRIALHICMSALIPLRIRASPPLSHRRVFVSHLANNRLQADGDSGGSFQQFGGRRLSPGRGELATMIADVYLNVGIEKARELAKIIADPYFQVGNKPNERKIISFDSDARLL